MGLRLTSDISRRLPSKSFEEGATLSLDIPRDSVFKHLQIRLSGSVVTTYAAGTPVADDAATFDRLVSSIDVVANGSWTIKNVTPWMMHIQSLLATSNFGVRRSSAGAAAVPYPTADGKFVYGLTTNYSSVVESILISFENVLAGKGRMSTLWDTRGLASAEMKIQCGVFQNLRGFGNTCAVAYTLNTMKFEIETIETQNLAQDVYFSTFKQTQKSVAFNAQTNDFLVDINRGNFLQGIMLQCRDGAAGGAAVATGKILTNTLVEGIKLILNGTNFIQNTKFADLQDKNRNRYGMNAAFVANKSLYDGMAYLDLLTPTAGEKFGDLATAQNVQAPAVDQVQLSIDTSATADYTNPCIVRIGTNELVKAQRQS